MLRCRHCGTRCRSDAAKCPSCGSTDIGEPDAAPPPPTAPPTPEPAPPVEDEPPPPKKRGWGTTLLVLGGGFALFTVGCLGASSLLGVAFVESLVSSPPPPPADGAGAFDAVRAQGRLVVAADPNAPPFLSGQPGAYEGFEYAIMSALADSIGVPLEIAPTPYDDLLDAVASGRAQMAVGQLPPQSRRGVVFTRSYLQYNFCLVVRDGEATRSLTELTGRTVGHYDDPLTRAVIDLWVSGNYTPRLYQDYGYFADLRAGALDGVVYDCPLARAELKTEGAGLRIADAQVGVGTYSIATTDQVPGLAAATDRVLGEIGNAGLLQQLAQRWLGESPPEDYQNARVRVAVCRGGEALSDVATRLGVDEAALADANRDILGGERGVYAGMALRIP